MGTVHRSLLYIRRKKGRTALALLILFLLSLAVLISVSIQRSVAEEITELKRSMGSSFLVKADTANKGYYESRTRDGFSYQSYVGPLVTDGMIEKISQIEGVSAYEINTYSHIWTELKLRPGAWMKSEAPPNELVTADYIEMSSQTTYALNCRTGELHPYFRSGAFEVIRGRNVQAGDRYKTVISENLAKRNGLDLHDTFRVEIKEGMMGPAVKRTRWKNFRRKA